MPEINPFAESAYRDQALALREKFTGRELGEPSDFELSGFKEFGNAYLGSQFGIQPFRPRAIPQVTMEDLVAQNPDVERELQTMDPAQRFLLFARQPEQLAALLASPEGVFERVFGDGFTDPALKREVELERARATGGRSLPRGETSLGMLEQASALQQIQDDTLRAQVEAVFLGQRGVLSPELAEARLRQSYGTAQAGLETAQLGPAKVEQEIAASQASEASARASARKTGLESEKLERGELLIFIDPTTNEAVGAEYERSPAGQALLAQKFVPFKAGSLSVQGATTGSATGTPGKGEVAKAGEELRRNVLVSQRVTDLIGRVTQSPRAFGPIAELARDNPGIALFDTASPVFADAVNRAVTGMDQEDFSRLRSDMDIFTTQMTPPITGETSRYSDSERVMVKEIGGTKGGTSRSAYIGKLKSMRMLIDLNDDKLAVIAKAPGEEYGDLFGKPAPGSKLTPSGQALMQKLISRGYEPKEAARMYRLIAAQRRELAVRGANAIGASLDEALGSGE